MKVYTIEVSMEVSEATKEGDLVGSLDVFEDPIMSSVYVYATEEQAAEVFAAIEKTLAHSGFWGGT